VPPVLGYPVQRPDTSRRFAPAGERGIPGSTRARNTADVVCAEVSERACPVHNFRTVRDLAPSVDQLVAEIGQLEHEEAALSRIRKKLHDQIDRGFGNDRKLRQEREISDQRRAIHRRIALLRAQLEAAQRSESNSSLG
jgi:septal ring factor EnvC (AmiA/AmiB activator)